MPRKKNPASDMDVAGKMKTPLAQRLNLLITDPNALKDFLDCTIQAVNQYKLGISRPSLENLSKIAIFYGVSTDYLLGLTDVKSPDDLTRAACNSVGLNDKSIKILSSSKQLSVEYVQKVIDRLLADEYYKNVEKTREYKTIIQLLDFFFEYQGKSSTMVVTQDGTFYENKHTDWSNEIRLDCQMVENAVLLEINRALINLKAHLNEEDHNNGQHHKNA